MSIWSWWLIDMEFVFLPLWIISYDRIMLLPSITDKIDEANLFSPCFFFKVSLCFLCCWNRRGSFIRVLVKLEHKCRLPLTMTQFGWEVSPCWEFRSFFHQAFETFMLNETNPFCRQLAKTLHSWILVLEHYFFASISLFTLIRITGLIVNLAIKWHNGRSRITILYLERFSILGKFWKYLFFCTVLSSETKNHEEMYLSVLSFWSNFFYSSLLFQFLK